MTCCDGKQLLPCGFSHLPTYSCVGVCTFVWVICVCAQVFVCTLDNTCAVTGSTDCKINSLDVSNCAADAQSCDFPRGQTINMTLKFTSTASTLCL